MTAETDLVVRKQIVVERSQADAFRVFTEEMGAWWPTTSHAIDDDIVDVVVEDRVGGRIYEVSGSGDTAEWGRILTWDAPNGLSVSWKPNRDPDAPRTVWVVTFEAIGDEVTRLELVHSGWEAYGAAAAERCSDYDSGWDPVLEQYVTHVTGEV